MGRHLGPEKAKYGYFRLEISEKLIHENQNSEKSLKKDTCQSNGNVKPPWVKI